METRGAEGGGSLRQRSLKNVYGSHEDTRRQGVDEPYGEVLGDTHGQRHNTTSVNLHKITEKIPIN